MDMVQSSNRIINNFPPLNNITPFTRVDGWSFLEVLEGLRNYVVNILVKEIDEDHEIITKQLQEWFEAYTQDFADLKQEWQDLFNEFINNIAIEIAELNDQGVSLLINNDDSLTSEALKNKYATIPYTDDVTAHGDLRFSTDYQLKTDLMSEGLVVRVDNVEASTLNIEHVFSNDDTGIISTGETPKSVYTRTRGDIVMNASGWWPETNRRVGLQILNGVLVQDWEPEPQIDWGIESFVVFKDGHLELCARAEETGQQLIDRGAWNAFTFGRMALRNGLNMGLESNPKYDGVTGRQCVGWDVDGNLFILTFPGATGVYGTTITEVYRKANELGLTDLYMLDGGGSTQTLVNGYPLVRSSDAGGERATPDAMVIHAQDTSLTYFHTPWYPLTLSAGVTPAQTGDYFDYRLIRRNGYTVCRIRARLTGATSGTQVAYIPRQAAWPLRFSSTVAGSNGGNTVNINISSTGNITAIGTALTPTSIFAFEHEFTVS